MSKRRIRSRFQWGLMVALLLGISSAAWAGVYRLVLETRADGPANSEVFTGTYTTFNNLLASVPQSSAFSAIDVPGTPAYSIAGLTYDGKYQMLFEADVDNVFPVPFEVYGGTYRTFADLLAGNAEASFGTLLNVPPGYSIAGLAYDGKYRVLFETDADSTVPLEVYVGTYATLNDLIFSNPITASVTNLDVLFGYSIAGFTYDGKYRVLFETDANAAAPFEVFAATYATFNDLVSNTPESAVKSALDIPSGYRIAAVAFAPEPGTPALVMLGLLALGVGTTRHRVFRRAA